MKNLLILAFAAFIWLPLRAQEVITLPDGTRVRSYSAEAGAPISDAVARMYRGVVVDAAGNPVQGVNVSCCQDCMYPQIYGAESGKTGKFAVKVVAGHYYVEFAAPGYDKLRLDVDLLEDLDAGSVVMTRSDSAVDSQNEMQIKYMRKFYQINVDAGLARSSGKMLTDLLMYAPFIDIWDDTKSVMLNPKYEIRVDGRPLNVSPEVMMRYFSSISAGDVRSIKVITASMAQERPTIVVITTK